ncbi:MAG: DUF3141 domain-containing protein [Myxococcota bacterium]
MEQNEVDKQNNAGTLASWMTPTFKPASDAADYARDFVERSILFLDVMRQRGDNYHGYQEQEKPNALGFEFEIVMDGRDLDEPCNYFLSRIQPATDTPCASNARPVVIIDPRAGHGPGIAGFKADSEIGMALENGLPCYFIGFSPTPLPGQTIDTIRRAETLFLRRVIELHPDADGLPFVIGNCQAGWALMMLAAASPEVVGPLLVVGSPISYWNGHRGMNPMRYLGGLLGGSWMTALSSALGGGIFDGAWLVANFENLNPSNTLFGKPYSLFSKIDTEKDRFLPFETWWGGHVTLNAEEIQFIVDELFIGNRLARGQMVTEDGVRLDLRKIRSPIVCFCSWGDNITPPPQALGWILDLYHTDEEVLESQQTIVYAIHDSIGHLGIFVSGSVARKEHAEVTSNIDLIDMLGPGIYEMVLEKVDPKAKETGFVLHDHITRFEPRDLDDIREIVKHTEDDERAFETVARISQTNLELFRMYVEPAIKLLGRPWMAEASRRMHPLRVSYEMWSSRNPLAQGLKSVATSTKEKRSPVEPDNSWLKLEQRVAGGISKALDQYRSRRDEACERLFYGVYGQRWLQALVGVGRGDRRNARRLGNDPIVRENREMKKQEVMSRINEGGKVAAFFRAMIYIGGDRITYDERTFLAFKAAHHKLASAEELAVVKQRQVSRDQYMMLRIDPERALAAIPKMLPSSEAERKQLLEFLDYVLDAGGGVRPEQKERYDRVVKLFRKKKAVSRAKAERSGSNP